MCAKRQGALCAGSVRKHDSDLLLGDEGARNPAERPLAQAAVAVGAGHDRVARMVERDGARLWRVAGGRQRYRLGADCDTHQTGIEALAQPG